jgi:hypothetical protein
MKSSIPDKKIPYKILTVIIPFVIFLSFLMKKYLFILLHFLPPCPFYNSFYIYCPGCGNTRSVTALLMGDIFTSLRFNALPLLLLILGCLLYIELASYSFGHHFKILPRKGSFYLIMALLMVLYFIIRNFIPYLTP